MKSSLWVLVGLLWVAQTIATPIPVGGTRCGGDGPRPLTDISGTFESEMTIYPTPTSLHEAVLSGEAENVIYRTDAHEMWKMEPSDPYKQTLVGHSTFSLSNVTDSAGNYLLAEGLGWIFDVRKPKLWTHYTDRKPLVHGFWNNGVLYSIDRTKTTFGSVQYRTTSYTPAGHTSRTCSFRPPTAFDSQLGEGHSFPYFFIYGTRKTSKGLTLSFWKLNAVSCAATEYEFKDVMEGPVRALYRYESINGTLIVVDHPTTNLLWQSGDSCRYFDRRGETILPLRFDRSVVASWSPRNGTSLIYLNEEKRTSFMEDVLMEHPSSSDFLMTRGADQIYVTPTVNHWKWLVRMDIETPLMTK